MSDKRKGEWGAPSWIFSFFSKNCENWPPNPPPISWRPRASPMGLHYKTSRPVQPMKSTTLLGPTLFSTWAVWYGKILKKPQKKKKTTNQKITWDDGFQILLVLFPTLLRTCIRWYLLPSHAYIIIILMLMLIWLIKKMAPYSVSY